MRKLTILRKKTFVACLMKIKVYIESFDGTGEEINGVLCRKLGEIANGEEATFEIGEGSAKVFVIIDKLSKNYCNDCYQIPEGTEDVYLCGQNKFNLATGNAFVFENNNNPQTQENRKRNTRKGLIVLIVCLVVGFAIGFVLGFSGLLG